MSRQRAAGTVFVIDPADPLPIAADVGLVTVNQAALLHVAERELPRIPDGPGIRSTGLDERGRKSLPGVAVFKDEAELDRYLAARQRSHEENK